MHSYACAFSLEQMVKCNIAILTPGKGGPGSTWGFRGQGTIAYRLVGVGVCDFRHAIFLWSVFFDQSALAQEFYCASPRAKPK